MGKSKKKKHKHKHRSSSSDSSSSEDGWVEAPKSKPPPSLFPLSSLEDTEKPAYAGDGLFPFLESTSHERQKKEKPKHEEPNKYTPGGSVLELNPYWKDGGAGLPSESKKSEASVKKVGDGGEGWLTRALKRAKEQARDEGRSLESVAAERWGSLENLMNLIEKSKGKTETSEQNKWKSRGDSSHNKFRKPTDSESGRHSYKDSKRHSDHQDDGHNESRKRYHNDNYKDSRRDSYKDSSSETKKGSYDNDNSHKSSHQMSNNEDNQRDVEKSRRPDNSDRTAESGESEILTEKEMNSLGAKIVKAEIMGNTELASTLKEKLEIARKASKNKPDKSITLSLTDDRGMSHPLSAPEVKQKGKKQKVKTHEDGQRVRYFPDDDRRDLQRMFVEEKQTTAADQNALHARLAGGGLTEKGDDLDVDDIFITRLQRKETEEKQGERQRNAAIKEHELNSKIMDRCTQCLEGEHINKQLVVCIAKHSYIGIPGYTPLTDGHCIIQPSSHVASQVRLDEDVFKEVQQLCTALVRMYSEVGSDCIFFETVRNYKKLPHMTLHCVPVDKEDGAMAPMYFKKALQESESEWSHNKKVINLHGKSIQKSVPRELPYFFVDFCQSDGFAHIIEDEKEFPWNFGPSVIGGILDLDSSVWRKHRPESYELQRKRVKQFNKLWDKYDFTKSSTY